MDLQTTIIGLSILAIIILPLVFLGNSGRRKEKFLLQSINKMASNTQGIVQRHETCGDMILGINEIQHFAYFFKNIKGENISGSVNLAEISQCKANKVFVTINKEENIELVDKLEIIFKPIDKTKPDIIWDIFNSDISTQLYGELQLVENWVFIFNSHIRKMKK
jgi:hypothetical protein